MLPLGGQSILDHLWTVSLQAAALALIALAVSRLARGAPAKLRYALWLLVLVKFLVPPVAHVPSGLAVWQRDKGIPETFQAEIARDWPSFGQVTPATDPTDRPTENPAHEGGLTIRSTFGVLGLCWIGGLTALLLLLAVRWNRQLAVMRASLPPEEELDRMASDAAATMGVRKFALRLSDRVHVPMLVGLLRSTILLPTCITDVCSPKDLEAIILHELAHARRKDMVVLWLYHLVNAVFFFHPALWLAGRELKREREAACDELVLSSSTLSPSDYARGYIAALELASSAATPTVLAMAEPFDIEKRRVEGILRYKARHLTLGWSVALGICSIGLVTFADFHPDGADPMARHIAAAMARQEALCGPSLEVEYTSRWSRTFPGVTKDQSLSTYRYVRTPEVQLYEQVRDGWKAQSSYDRRTDMSRQVVTSSGRTTGEESKGLGMLAGNQDALETVRYLLYEGPLCERLRYGAVSRNPEPVDGYNCLRVEIPSRRRHLDGYVVWVDPKIGFNPRRIEFKWTDKKPTVVTYESYTSIRDGAWFPRKQVIHYQSRQHLGAFRVVNAVSSVRCGRRIPADDLLLSLP